MLSPSDTRLTTQRCKHLCGRPISAGAGRIDGASSRPRGRGSWARTAGGTAGRGGRPRARCRGALDNNAPAPRGPRPEKLALPRQRRGRPCQHGLRHRQAAVVEESAEGGALVAGVAEGLRDRRLVEDEGGLLLAPVEKGVGDRPRFLTTDLFALLAGGRLQRPLESVKPADQRERVLGPRRCRSGERVSHGWPEVSLVSGLKRAKDAAARGWCGPLGHPESRRGVKCCRSRE